ncbi:MAG: hypothetical protein H6662_14295 [Ardenticatenaceae bacterium]|nr:hypothetical protein [Anaerolineales bacterium]MCB8922754.1 hypothetical protein [Ardenticatenaceae bacterium]
MRDPLTKTAVLDKHGRCLLPFTIRNSPFTIHHSSGRCPPIVNKKWERPFLTPFLL